MITYQHPLTNEETLTEWIGIFCCNSCEYLRNNKCSHESSDENEKDKITLKESFPSDDINSIFLCDNFKRKE